MAIVHTIYKKIYDLLVSWGLGKASTMGYGAVPVGTSVTPILGSQTTRKALVITNTSATTVYIGGSAVTTASGIPLEKGDVYENQVWTGVIYGITASGTADVRVEDFY